VHATLRYENGSTATISYITGGNSRYPKETLDAAGAGRSARLDNFRKATVWNGRKENATKGRLDKGQATQLEKFTEACVTGGPMPISVESLVATTRATIAVAESLLSSRPERV
jgi:predicted dehydrogenase